MSYGFGNPPVLTSAEATTTELTAIVKNEIPKAHWKNSIPKKKEEKIITANDENKMLYIIFLKIFIYHKSPIIYLVMN